MFCCFTDIMDKSTGFCSTGDFNYSHFGQISTSVLTNIAPQYHEFNTGKPSNPKVFCLCRILGLWLIAENKVYQWALTYSEVYVISGSILGKNRRDQHGNYDW